MVRRDIRQILTSMNKELSREFTSEEIFVALQQMYPTKTSEPDGMPPLFFHKYSHIVKDSVTEAVLHVLN